MLSAVHFDTKPFRNVKWEVSKRLIYGSLVCFSTDHFQHDLIFATVANRDPKKLKRYENTKPMCELFVWKLERNVLVISG